MTNDPMPSEDYLLRKMKYVSTELCEDASTMGLAQPQIIVNVLLGGQASSARFPSVNNRAVIMVIVHTRIPARVNVAGLGSSVRFLCVHRIVTMEFVLPLMSASVINGRMNGEMVELVVVFHFSRSPTGIRN
jgi:hypothetical protein